MQEKHTPDFWLQKPYYSLDAYCKKTYGEKLYKIALNAGLTCPNRDGTLDTRGCIFCSAGGSGDFSVPLSGPLPPKQSLAQAGGTLARERSDAAIAGGCGMREQLAAGRALFGGKRTGQRFIAYFQAYTNTYGPVSYLRSIYTQALSEPDVAGISIATRPDCLGPEVLALLCSLSAAYPDKFIWVELGLQTVHEDSARYIRRGYPLPVFEQAVASLHALGIPVIAHVILGLPSETPEQMKETVRYLNTLPVRGVKLQLLHVLSGTDLADDYARGRFEVLTQEAYLTLLADCIALLSPDKVIHRLTGDGPRELLLAPLWSADKRRVLNGLHHMMKQKNIWQGADYHGTGTIDSL